MEKVVFNSFKFDKAEKFERRKLMSETKRILPEVFSEPKTSMAFLRDFLNKKENELCQMKKERDMYRALHDKHIRERDICKICAAYPDEISPDNCELGDDFYALMSTGKMDAVAAYEIVSKIMERQSKPPVMGDVSTKGRGSELLSRAQVEKMSQSEVDRNFARIMKSMEHWK